MKTYLKNAVKLTAFLAIAVLILSHLGKVMSVQKFQSRYYSTLSSFEGFYSLEENTLDAVFLGSSHGYNSYWPQQLYDDYGIRSYNLSTSMQGPIASYYWLEEVLKTQTPRAVIFEVCFLFHETDEPSIRKAFDPMHLSKNKLRAVKELYDYDPVLYDPLSFVFPLVRYHERWKEPQEVFFEWQSLADSNTLKGFYPGFGSQGEVEGYTFAAPSSMDMAQDAGKEVPDNFCLAYLYRMTSLCQEKGISLILTSSPSTRWTKSQHNFTAEYAAAHGLPFYDFNCEDIYTGTGYDIEKDNLDSGHPNLLGTEKITAFLGEKLSGDFGIQPSADPQWENTKSCRELIKEDFVLRRAYTLPEFLEAADKERYTVYFVTDGKFEPSQESIDKLAQMGFVWQGGRPVCAVIEGGGSLTGETELSGAFDGGRYQYRMSVEEKISTIRIGSEEHTWEKGHFHIAVYDNVLGNVVDIGTY